MYWYEIRSYNKKDDMFLLYLFKLRFLAWPEHHTSIEGAYFKSVIIFLELGS
jgi:hypothetical protein